MCRKHKCRGAQGRARAALRTLQNRFASQRTTPCFIMGTSAFGSRRHQVFPALHLESLRASPRISSRFIRDFLILLRKLWSHSCTSGTSFAGSGRAPDAFPPSMAVRCASAASTGTCRSGPPDAPFIKKGA